MNPQQRDELLSLLSALADDALTEPQQQRLGELLHDDADAQALYLDYCELQADLLLHHQTGDLLLEPASPTKPASKRVFGLSALAVACVASAASLLFAVGLWQARPPETTPGLATLLASENASWQGRSFGDNQLAAGWLELSQGSLHLRMNSGADLFLEGPARLELLDAKAVRLAGGNVTIDVPDAAIGFRVITPGADVVDLGTQFNVSVDEEGATEVHVARGVVVAKSSGTESVVPILRGEAGRVELAQGEMMPTRFDAQRFAKLPVQEPPPAEDLPKYPPLAAGSRVVFLGDRTTDRETHLLLINQALAGLGEERPLFFNAGVSFPLWFEEAEFQTHVTSFQPTHAVLEFGPDLAKNTGKHLVSPQRFEQAILTLVERLEQAEIEPLLSLGYPLAEEEDEAQQRLTAYNQFLQELAQQRGYRLIDAERRFRANDDRTLLARNGHWPTFAGYREIARATLAGFGYPEAKVASSLKLSLLPGVIPQWQYRFKSSKEPLSAAEIASLQVGDQWQSLTLPQPPDKFARRTANRSHLISYRDRSRGFATNLHQTGSQGVIAMAAVSSPQARQVFLNTGATVQSVWLNGELVYQSEGWSGWHAGKERIPATLRAGENRIVIETGSSFFFSITEQQDWPLPVQTP